MKRYSKAIGAGVGTGLGAAVSTLIIYLLRQFGVEVPADVEAAIAVICTAVITIIGVYLAPPNDPLPMQSHARKKHWSGAWMLPLLAPVLSLGIGDITQAQYCPGGICPTAPPVVQTRRVVQRPLVTRSVTRSYGSTGSVYRYGSTGSTYLPNVSNFTSYSYTYGSTGSRSAFWGRGPFRRLLSAPFRAFRRARQRAAVNRVQFAYADPVTVPIVRAYVVDEPVSVDIVQPTQQDVPEWFADAQGEPFACIQPGKRKPQQGRTFTCIRPGKAVAVYDWREPRGTYAPRWINRDGKTITQHLIDGFPGEHEPLPSSYVLSLTIDDRWRLHDTLHDAG